MARRKGGRSGIREAIDAAETVQPPPEPPKGEAPTLSVAGGRLEMRADGLFRAADEKAPLRVSGAFEVLAQTRDDDAQAWGLMLRFRDPDGRVQHVVATRDMFAGEGGELRNLLARRGLYVNPSQAVRGLLVEYLSRVGTDKRVRIVGRTGWHRIDGAPVFVLPGQTFGRTSVEVVYQPALHDVALFAEAGTLAAWQEEVAARCVGNSRLVLAVSAAFTGPLLDIVGEEGGGIHFRGASRVGKTTALRVAASVWGGEGAGGAAAFIRQWRATGNAVEGVAGASSDTLLPLDELGQADPREVGDIAYLLASGQGKARSDRAGGLRAPIRFRVLFLSTGELSLADKIAEAGRRVKAGQEVRLVDVPADAGRDLGLFEELHDAPDPERFTQLLRLATANCYGVAAPAFLRYLIGRLAGEVGFADQLRDWMASLVADWTRDEPETSGQVRSVARRFALVAVAGELATAADITGWTPNEAAEAAGACFRAWLGVRGTAGAREDAQAVTQLRDFLTRHGSARFDVWQEDAQGRLDLRTPTVEPYRTANRAGWRRPMGDGHSGQAWEYMLTADGMGEALTGLDRRAAHQALIKRGFLTPDREGRAARSTFVPGHGQLRLYHIASTIISAADGDT